MEVNKILSADLLDIIFDGRNKSYGAYDLRKTYSKRFAESILIAVAIFTTAVAIPKIFSSFKSTEKPTQLYVRDIALEDLKQQDKKNMEVPPPPPKQDPPKIEITKFTPPKIVKDEDVKDEDQIKEVAKLEDTKIGIINQEGTKDDGIVAPPVEAKGSGVVQAPKQEEDYDKLFTTVEIPAEFPGGKVEWQKYLERNLNREVPIQNGAPVGTYIVTVTFIVDKNGFISDIQALNDPGYGVKEEAIRVLKKGPNWIPAVQNGRKVNYKNSQHITFIISEENY
jgi:periplasmic protein TonB